VTPTRSALIEFPNDLDIVITREFDAPIALVFDVLTKPEHVTRWFFDRELKECSIDLRVGGDYHFVFITDEGAEMTFHGTYLEIEPPTRTVATWLVEGRPEGHPDAHATESLDLHEADGTTTITVKLSFTDAAARPTKFDGMQDGYDRMDDLLRTLLDRQATVSG
jgi:uncharacterized protein YndB with AHSA1/START domain